MMILVSYLIVVWEVGGGGVDEKGPWVWFWVGAKLRVFHVVNQKHNGT